MKKFLLTLSLIITALSVNAQAFWDGDFYFQPNDENQTATLLSYWSMQTSDVECIIPSVAKNYYDVEYTVVAVQGLHSHGEFVSIEIPNTVTSLAKETFAGCGNVKTVKIGDGITTLNADDFGYCTSIETVEIGSGITSIDKDTFLPHAESTSITSMTIHAVNPPECNGEVIEGVTYPATLYVPAESVDAYKAHATWSKFNIQAIGSTGIDAISSDDALATYYNLNGSKVCGELTPGLYIARKGAKTTKVIVK